MPGSGCNRQGKAGAGVGFRKRVVLRADERRLYARLPLNLPLRVKRIAGQPAAAGNSLFTKDISSCGVRFMARQALDVDTPVELEIELVTGPLAGRHLQMVTLARIVRVEAGRKPGWHEYAASFEEITFLREAPASRSIEATEVPATLPAA